MKYISCLLLFIMICVTCWGITLEEQLGYIPDKKIMSSLPLKNEFFIIGSGAQMGAYGTESAQMFKKYTINPVWNAHMENFDDARVFRIMKDAGLPCLTQGWGMSFADYLKERDALDYTWGDLNPNKNTTSAMAHELAMPHPAVRELWENYIKASVNSGGAGYVFCDQVTPWDFGRGSGGFNPETIAAFRMDLLGYDKGVRVNMDGKEKTIFFKDYAEFYLGYMPDPKVFGYDSWDKYYPVRKVNYDPEGYAKYVIDPANTPDFYFNTDSITKSDFIPDFLLRDMLIHYEALKFTDFLGQTAAQYGGVYFPMPNTEDMANGNDMLFMSSLSNVQGLMEEYFQAPSYNDTAYTRIDYLTKNIKNIKDKKFGFVLESGGGGNACPYYDHYVSYIQAYEGKFVNNASMLEGDFWPNLHPHLSVDTPVMEYASSSDHFKARMKAILAYGNGFKYACKDKGSKLAPDFTTVVSRRIFRPWGKEYKTFTCLFGDPNKDTQPEEMLYNAGYVFNTVGFEDAENLKGEIVLWDVNTPPVLKFERFINRMEEGYINTAVAVAENFDKILDMNFRIGDLKLYFPSYATEKVSENVEEKVVCRGQEMTIYGDIYKPAKGDIALKSDDGKVLLYRHKVNKCNFYILPFNPGLKENAPIAKYVYDIVLNRSGVLPHWEQADGSGVAVYRNSKGLIVRLRNKCLNYDVFGDIYKNEDPMKQRCAYEIGEPTEAKIKCDKPNHEYYIYNYFDGEETKEVSDKYGYVPIRSENKSLSIFFIRDREDKSLMKDLAERREEFGHLLGFQG